VGFIVFVVSLLILALVLTPIYIAVTVIWMDSPRGQRKQREKNRVAAAQYQAALFERQVQIGVEVQKRLAEG
jgi:hypothetical protein